MHYEHIVQINDPRDPRVQPVDAAALWRAVLLSATEPQRFRPELDGAEVVALEPMRWQRRLHFGTLTAIEDLRADAQAQSLVQSILAPPELAGGSRTVRIEAPAPGHLVLRFLYASPHASAGTDADQRNAFRSAYRQADLAQVEIMRAWLATQPDSKP